MKPRTKKEIEIATLSQKLPLISQKQRQYIQKVCFDKVGYRTPRTLTCMQCGNKIKYTNKKHCVCEKCGAKLVIFDTYARTNKSKKYHCLITTVEKYQVLRFFVIEKYEKKGSAAQYCIYEAIRHFIDENGKDTIFALETHCGWSYIDLWDKTSEMSLKHINRKYYYSNEKYFINPLTYGSRWRILPILRRNGLQKNFYEINPADVCCLLLNNNKIETLWKAKQYACVAYFKNYNEKLNELWQTICICLRNNYIIEDVSMWCDYIQTLHYFKKDCRNAFYACPTNLKEAHDKLLHKKIIYEAKKEKEERKKKVLTFEKRFKHIKGKYINIHFEKNNIEISALKSVMQYIDEAEAMHHCVFDNEYFLKPNSLILSARVDGERAETVEVSLLTGKVIQSRAKYNGQSEYHKDIITLVNDQFINKLKIAEKNN